MRPVFLACLVLPLVLTAADTDTRLQELLKRYPEADTNKDGTLTFEEAQAHAKKLRRPKSGETGDDGGGTPPDTSKKPAPTHTDVSYGPHERHKLDLWLARPGAPAPLLVYIHGGGFVNGSKAGASATMIRESLAAGVSFMAINYRFRESAPIQDILRDCARAIQFVRSQARAYGIDPTRIASYGGSAGATASLWLAFHDDLADPGAADPVLRESSRIVGAGAINTQATMNVLRWPEFLGPAQREWSRPGETTAFYGAATEAELSTPKFKAILDDVDMLGLVSRDDPPVFLFSAQPDGPLANRGHALHHPNHARAVKQVCDAAGVSATAWFGMAEPRIEGDYQRALREFLFARLGVKQAGR
ncbi:MAG: alpha/beta hydrolase [Opitutaceae bacterium]|nr:alpha/beta hydrolase [Opitutaceae bacterium]